MIPTLAGKVGLGGVVGVGSTAEVVGVGSSAEVVGVGSTAETRASSTGGGVRTFRGAGWMSIAFCSSLLVLTSDRRCGLDLFTRIGFSLLPSSKL